MLHFTFVVLLRVPKETNPSLLVSVCTQLKKISGQFRQKTDQAEITLVIYCSQTCSSTESHHYNSSKWFWWGLQAICNSTPVCISPLSPRHSLDHASAHHCCWFHCSGTEFFPHFPIWTKKCVLIILQDCCPSSSKAAGIFVVEVLRCYFWCFPEQAAKKIKASEKKTKTKQNKPVKTQLSSRLQINLILPSFKHYLAVAQCYNSSSHWQEAPGLTRQNTYQIVLQKCVYLLIQK